MELTGEQRRYLRALAHSLNPVVTIGNQGLTAAVIREIAQSLDAHELIKIRVHSGDRETRLTMYHTICQDLDASPVQHIGKLLILYRPTTNIPKVTLPKEKKR